MSNSPENSSLGKKVSYKDQYDPSLLFPIPRETKRNEIQLSSEDLPFHGVDIWNAYELSWLNSRGLPQVAIAQIHIDATSQNIIESKSFKLYLNSFNQSKFSTRSEVQNILREDIQKSIQGEVEIQLYDVDKFSFEQRHQAQSQCIDQQDIEIKTYLPDPNLLETENNQIEESLHSHLLKSNCLVTGQPDWASLYIKYEGLQITRSSLLKYIVSFRNHNEFHEQCVERIFNDISMKTKPKKLSVYARYTRRGGLDINPFRSNFESPYKNFKLARQ